MHYRDYKGILSAENGINPYRGCTHGCIYCDSRSLCYHMEHPFEDVEIKRNAAQLLEDALRRKRKRCMIGTGAMCDPYMPLEADERLTLRCLETICRHGFGATVQTKSDLVLRDVGLLREINARSKAVVQMTLTTCDETLCRLVEPNVCTTRRRFEVLCRLREEKLPTVVWITPLLPFLNDTEENLRGLLALCFEAGVKGILSFGMGVTLREGDREYFYAQLDQNFPGIKEKYIRTFGGRYECPSPNAERLNEIFHTECEKRGVLHQPENVFPYLRAFEDKSAGTQTSLFGMA